MGATDPQSVKYFLSQVKKKELNSIQSSLFSTSSFPEALPQEPSEGIQAETPENRVKNYQSIFDWSKIQPDPTRPQFFTPDAFKQVSSIQDLTQDLKGMNPWDLAIRYHDYAQKLKSDHRLRGLAQQVREISAEAILQRAQAVLGSVVHPVQQSIASWLNVPPSAAQIELDLDETIENAPLQLTTTQQTQTPRYPLHADDIWMSFNTHRLQSVILTIDTSLSMTGEKLALTAVALAVVLLEFPDDPIGIVGFENEPKVLKTPYEKLTVKTLIERFLDVPAQGYTHLEAGLKAALKLVSECKPLTSGRPPSTVLLTDGKYTAGRDPTYLASRFPHLVVLKMGSERASIQLCRDLARKGSGTVREIDDLTTLPLAMYAAIKEILQGRI